MPNAFSLWGKIEVDTKGFETSLTKAHTSLKQTETALTRTERAAVRAGTHASAGMDRMRTSAVSTTGAVSRLASTAGMLAGGAIATMAGMAVKSAISFDSLKMALTAVAGSGAKAAEQFTRLKEVAKAPGLGFKEAIQGSVNLQAAGLAATTAERALMAFGNALGTVGKGKAELDGVITALSQIQSKGKVSAEEINQLAERLPQIRVAMQNAFGTADTEALQKMGLTSTAFIEKIITEFEKLPKVVGGAQNSIDNFRDTLEQTLAPVGQKILDSVLPAMNTLADEMGKDNPNYMEAGKKIGAKFGDGVGAGIAKAIENLPAFTDLIIEKLKPPKEGETPIFLVFGSSLMKSLLKGLNEIDTDAFWKEISTSWIFTLTTLGARMPTIGVEIVQGLINGITSKISEAEGTMRVLAGRLVAAAQSPAGFWINSPSKHFIKIGESVGEGLVVGINSMQVPVADSMTKLIKSVTPKGIDKKVAEQFKELQKSLTETLTSNAATSKGYGQSMPFEVEKAKAEKMKSDLRDLIDTRIELGKNLDKPLIVGPGVQKELTYLNSLKEGAEKLKDVFDTFLTKFLPEKSNIEQLNDALAGPDVQKALGSYSERLRGIIVSTMRINARNKDFEGIDLGQGSGVGNGGEPGMLGTGKEFKMDDSGIGEPPRTTWEQFWQMMQFRMAQWQQSLPSLKQAIGENLIASIDQIGATFGQAVGEWIETGKGFFQSIAQGFRRMVAQIISELVRLMVFKFLMKMLGMAGASIGSVSGALSSGVGSIGTGVAGGTASLGGGLASLGGGLAMGGMASMGGMMPAMASSSSSTTTNAPVFHINIQGGGSPRETVRNVKQGIREAIAVQDRERLRNK